MAASMPDFEKMAAVYDRNAHLIAPVGDAVLAELPALPDGALVVDVACGTGEPGLTLARRRPGVRVVGVDAAQAMIAIARGKADRERLGNVRFEVMQAEQLAFDDASARAVTSRFGMWMFGDRHAQVRELLRVLAKGGAFSVAIWDGMKDNTYVRGTVGALRPYLPAEQFAPFDTFPSAIAEDEIRALGVANVSAKEFRWSYPFASEDALWEFTVGGGMFEKHFGALREEERAKIKAALIAFFAPFRHANGGYVIPHACKIYYGTR